MIAFINMETDQPNEVVAKTIFSHESQTISITMQSMLFAFSANRMMGNAMSRPPPPPTHMPPPNIGSPFGSPYGSPSAAALASRYTENGKYINFQH